MSRPFHPLIARALGFAPLLASALLASTVLAQDDVEMESIAPIAVPLPVEAAIPPGEPVVEATPLPATLREPAKPPVNWSGRVEAGLNGTTGNAERFNVRLGANIKRKSERGTFLFDTVYSRGEADGLETENKSLSKARQEWAIADSYWSPYAYSTLEYDEFQAWDVRVTAGGGWSYRLLGIEDARFLTKRTNFTPRLGAGFSREINGPSDRYVPELNVGGDYEYIISERQKLTGAFDVYPDFGDFRDFRAVSKASWSIVVDPEHGLTLEMGILDRYDSTPEGRERNDLDFFALLVWDFD